MLYLHFPMGNYQNMAFCVLIHPLIIVQCIKQNLIPMYFIYFYNQAKIPTIVL